MIRRNEAISEVVGSILLVSLVVLAVAIIGVGFLSQPPPVQTQDLNVIAGYDEINGTLFLQHDGGDLMTPGEYYILIDGGSPIYPEEWGIGKRLTFSGVVDEPERVQIISTRGGQQNLIRSIRIGQVTGGGVPVTPGPAPTPGPGGGCTQQELDDYLNTTYISKFSDELNNDAIYFIRDRLETQSKDKLSGYINFTINSTGSYFILAQDNDQNPERRMVPSGARISLHYNYGNDNGAGADIFSVGSKGWSFGGKKTRLFVNDTLINKYSIDSNIERFDDYKSTLTFVGGDKNSYYTRLVIKNQTIVDGWDNRAYTFIGVKPAKPTLLVLNHPVNQNEQIRFIGQADAVLRDGVPIYQNGVLLITA